MSNPARSAISVAATNWSVTASMSARFISLGTALDADHGMGGGGHHRPVAIGQWPVDLLPAELRAALATGWPIWQQILARSRRARTS